MHYTHDDIPRSFRVPFGPWLIPIVGILLCILLLINTTREIAVRFGVLMGIGQIVYFGYGFLHSKARLRRRRESCTTITEPVPAAVFVITDTPKTDLESEITDKESQV
jgi:amino acid transporter